MYLIFIALVAALTIALPWLVPRIASKYGKTLQPAAMWLPFLAAAFYIMAVFLPDIHISQETNTFQEHFVGGGGFTALLFIYFTKLLGWRPRWTLLLLGLFAWTSALGTANELLEFTLVKLNITSINISDTSWDLVANTTGSLAVFIIWGLLNILEKHKRRV